METPDFIYSALQRNHFLLGWGYYLKQKLFFRTTDCCDAGEFLAFDCFEEGTATGGHIAYLVGETEFVDAGNRIAATYE